jgi:AP-3 complex subunit sigma
LVSDNTDTLSHFVIAASPRVWNRRADAMIKAVVVMNTHGQPRLTKFYEYTPEDRQQQFIRDAFALLSRRVDGMCNFIHGGTDVFGPDVRVIYRHYATLFFVFCVDTSESELGMLDLIQVFVETLDRCFENVCELDLIFHMDKINFVLDELVVGGLVLETNMADILEALAAAKRAK